MIKPICFLFVFLMSTLVWAAEDSTILLNNEIDVGNQEYDPFEDMDDIQEDKAFLDPLEPWNRMVFKFNDTFYFSVYKPVAEGYSFVVPEGCRMAVRRFFHNIFMPARFVNTALQGKIKGSGIVLARFGINTTAGVLGFFDVAEKHCHLKRQDEDMGQTLGFYGLGPGFYIVWPVLGPSSLRDSIGLAGDSFLDPLPYVLDAKLEFPAIAYENFNDNSLEIGLYEEFKANAIEPYSALRNAYFQNRQEKIRQ